MSACGPLSNFTGTSTSVPENKNEQSRVIGDASGGKGIAPEQDALPTTPADAAKAGPTVLAPLNGPDGDVTAPPGSDTRAPLPGQSGNALMPNGLPALQPHGVDLQKLFAEDIKDPDARIKRVENAVVEMRRDFDAVLPSIVRLVAVEQDMQDLTKQLGVLLQNEPGAIASAPGVGSVSSTPLPPPGALTPAAALPPPAAAKIPTAPPVDVAAKPMPLLPAPSSPAAPKTAPASEPIMPVMNSAPAAQSLPLAQTASPPISTVTPIVPVAPQVKQPEEATASKAVIPAPATPPPLSDGKIGSSKGGLQVRDLRIGEHPGTTRLVLVVSGKASYHADLDNDENLLVVEVSDAGWDAKAKETIANSPLIASWTEEKMDGGKGSRLILTLKKSARILSQSLMPGDAKEPYKIVIDLADGK